MEPASCRSHTDGCRSLGLTYSCACWCVAHCSNVGAGTSLDVFAGSRLALRRCDGARVFASIPPQPVLLHELVRQGRWDKAVRLAR
jgi:hypothetical protein